MDLKMKRLINVVLVLIALFFVFQIYPRLLGILYFVIKLGLPFILGFTGAFILLPIVDFFERHHFNRKGVVIVVCLLFIGIIVAFFAWLVPIVFNQVGILIENIPQYLENIEEKINMLCEKLSFLPDEYLPTTTNIGLFIQKNIDHIYDFFLHFIQDTFSYIYIMIVTPVLLFYFMLDYNKIVDRIKDWAVKHEKKMIPDMLREMKNTMRAYFKGIVLVMIILSMVSALCFKLIGLELALLWGIIIGITNIIPYVGPYIGGVVVALFTLTTMPGKFLMVIIIVVVLQIIESNFITPNIESKTVKTHPLLVIFFLTFFGQIFGIFGMIIAVPVLSLLQIIIKYGNILKNKQIS